MHDTGESEPGSEHLGVDWSSKEFPFDQRSLQINTDQGL